MPQCKDLVSIFMPNQCHINATTMPNQNNDATTASQYKTSIPYRKQFLSSYQKINKNINDSYKTIFYFNII